MQTLNERHFIEMHFLLSGPPVHANISLYNEAQSKVSLLITDEQRLSLVTVKVVKLRMRKRFVSEC